MRWSNRLSAQEKENAHKNPSFFLDLYPNRMWWLLQWSTLRHLALSYSMTSIFLPHSSLHHFFLPLSISQLSFISRLHFSSSPRFALIHHPSFRDETLHPSNGKRQNHRFHRAVTGSSTVFCSFCHFQASRWFSAAFLIPSLDMQLASSSLILRKRLLKSLSLGWEVAKLLFYLLRFVPGHCNPVFLYVIVAFMPDVYFLFANWTSSTLLIMKTNI